MKFKRFRKMSRTSKLSFNISKWNINKINRSNKKKVSSIIKSLTESKEK